ncbi:MAG: ABC transporter ATP-binding protein [Candidatus Saccharimonadales bacterium]
MSPRNSIIFIEHLTKRFGGLTAVDDIGFMVKPGEIVGFVGPNGAGKTTTISLIMGYLHATSGTIRLFGDDVVPSNAHQHHVQIGYTAGDMSLLNNLTGKQYLAHMAALTRPNSIRQKELIELINPVLDKKLKHLSRGNKQKIALIAALQHGPKLLVLDEPTTGLDPLMQETFLHLIKQEAKEGATVFMSSHILSEVTSICSRVMFMKRGAIVLDSTVAEIEAQAGKEITITADKKTLVALLKTHPAGLINPKQRGSAITFLYQGKIGPITTWLASHSLRDVTIRDRDFDSIFHDMYNDEGSAR